MATYSPEITIKRIGRMLTIATTTNDARAWIDQEAPRFGNYFSAGSEWFLDISKRYDPSHAVDYLLSYLAWDDSGEVKFWEQPRPKKELSIKVAMGILFIFVNSDDAHIYIQQESPKFGDLFPEAGGSASNYSLFPSPSHKAQQVAAHLINNFKKE